jgi:hypothetical protein
MPLYHLIYRTFNTFHQNAGGIQPPSPLKRSIAQTIDAAHPS